jgi:microcompartment protein CcmK/EutM
MKLGTVVGTVVSPVSHPFFEGQKLLLCDLIGPDGGAGGSLICVDVVNAGAGERVLICDEGTSARQIFGIPTGPIRSVIVGIIDAIEHDAEASSP